MAVQITYSKDHAANYKGQVVDANDAGIFSAVSEAIVPVGTALIEGSAAGTVIEANAAGTFKGVSVRSLDIQATAAGVIQYEDEQEVACLRRGRIAVEADETVAAGEPVFFVHTGGNEGTFRNDVDAGNAQIVVGAEFVTGGTVGQIVVINIPSVVA